MFETHVHIHHCEPPGVVAGMEAILLEMKKMSAELDRLTNEVQETKTAIDSAVTLIKGLAQQIRDHVDDPAKLKELADELDSKTNELGAAVVANTPE